jgi:hypothetical protein
MEEKELRELIELEEQYILGLCDLIAKSMEKMEAMKVMLNDKLREG